MHPAVLSAVPVHRKPYVKNYKVGNLIYHFWNVDVDTAAQNQ